DLERQRRLRRDLLLAVAGMDVDRVPADAGGVEHESRARPTGLIFGGDGLLLDRVPRADAARLADVGELRKAVRRAHHVRTEHQFGIPGPSIVTRRFGMEPVA